MTTFVNFNQIALLIEAIPECWMRETSVYPDAWSKQNPALGQAIPTVLLLQDFFGGEIKTANVITPTNSGWRLSTSHYFNQIGRHPIDITTQQYPTGTAIPYDQATRKRKDKQPMREYLLDERYMPYCYELLLELVERKTGLTPPAPPRL